MMRKKGMIIQQQLDIMKPEEKIDQILAAAFIAWRTCLLHEMRLDVH